MSYEKHKISYKYSCNQFEIHKSSLIFFNITIKYKMLNLLIKKVIFLIIIIKNMIHQLI